MWYNKPYKNKKGDLELLDLTLLIYIYYDEPFSRECGSQKIGTTSLGVVTIPSDIKYVTVKTSGFLVYFNNEDWWTSTGELNGLCDCNQ